MAGGFFVTGINLTEDLKYICTHPTESLKDLVMSTYPTLLSWVKEQTPGSRVGSLNIIAGDFITESHFVPTVVKLNEKLLKWSSWLSTVNLHYSTLEKKMWIPAWNTHELVFYNSYRRKKRLKYLNHSSSCGCTYRKQWNVHFSLEAAWKKTKKKTDVLVFSTCTCLFTFSSLYMQCTVSVVTKSARWPVLRYGDQSNNYTPNLTLT